MSIERARPNISRVIRHGKEKKNTPLPEVIDLYSRIYQDREFEVFAGETVRNWLDTVDRDDLDSSVQIAKAAIPLIQRDTIGELYALSVNEKNNGAKERNPGRYDKDALNDIDQGRLAVYVLVSNLFNREDEKVEQALAHGASGEMVDNGEIIMSTLRRGRAVFIEKDDKKIPVTPEEYIIAMCELARHVGVDSRVFVNSVEKVVKAQIDGLAMLNREYTVEDAIEYKINTVGTYYFLLSQIAYDKGDAKKASSLIRRFMRAQFTDDKRDVREDMGTQPSPFIALLKKYDLWEDFCDSGKSFKKYMKSCCLDFSNEFVGISKAYVGGKVELYKEHLEKNNGF